MSELTHQGAFRLIYKRRRTGAEESVLHGHLQHCPDCRQDAQMAGLFTDNLVLKTLPTRPSPQFSAVYREQAARRSRRSHIMKPIYAVGGAFALALLMLAGWFIIRSNFQTATLDSVPVETVVSTAPETQVTPQSETAVGPLDEQLIAAVEAGDTAEVGQLLESGANPDAEDIKGNAVIAMAAGDGQLEIVQLLLEAGADVNGTMKTGSKRGRILVAGLNESALGEAVINNHIEIIELLIAYGADVDHTEDNMGTTPLHYAAMANNPEVIKILLENGADPNLPNDWKLGYTALHFAVSTGAPTAAEALLDGGVDANVQTEQGLTPMMTALTENFSEGRVTTMLLEHGADPNIEDNIIGNTALHYAARGGKTADIQILLENDVDVNQQNRGGDTALHRASKQNKTGAVAVLLEYGASVDLKNNKDQTALDVATNEEIIEMLREAGAVEGAGAETAVEPLDEQFIAAVESGNVAEVERLLGADANPDAEDDQGNAALARAARDGQLEIAQLLLDAGADVNSRGSFLFGSEDAAISLAATYNHLAVVELLIAHGADVDLGDTEKNINALQSAAQFNNADVIRLLLENGADPNWHSDWNEGETPLHWATWYGATEAAEALIDGGADVNIQTDEGTTPLMKAVSDGDLNARSSIVPLLLEHGANPNIQDRFGNTALHVAATGAEDVIVPLLEGGAQIDLQNNLGETPLHVAAKSYATPSAELLIEQGASLDIKNNEGQTALDVAGNQKIKEMLREAGAE